MNYSRWSVRLLALFSLLCWYALPPGMGAVMPVHAAEYSNATYTTAGYFAGDNYIADDDHGQNAPHRTHARRPLTGKVKVKIYTGGLPPATPAAQVPDNTGTSTTTTHTNSHLPVPYYYSHLYRLALF